MASQVETYFYKGPRIVALRAQLQALREARIPTIDHFQPDISHSLFRFITSKATLLTEEDVNTLSLEEQGFYAWYKDVKKRNPDFMVDDEEKREQERKRGRAWVNNNIHLWREAAARERPEDAINQEQVIDDGDTTKADVLANKEFKHTQEERRRAGQSWTWTGLEDDDDKEDEDDDDYDNEYFYDDISAPRCVGDGGSHSKQIQEPGNEKKHMMSLEYGLEARNSMAFSGLGIIFPTLPTPEDPNSESVDELIRNLQAELNDLEELGDNSEKGMDQFLLGRF